MNGSDAANNAVPTLEQLSDEARPKVARPPDRFTMPAIFTASLLLGLFVFTLMSQGRADAEPMAAPPPPPPPPVMVAQAEIPPEPEPVVEDVVEEPAPGRDGLDEPPPPDPNQDPRLRAPSLIVDLSVPTPPPAPGVSLTSAAATAAAAGTPGAPALTNPITQALTPPNSGAASQNRNESFAQRLGIGTGGGGPVQATRMSNLGMTVPEGAMISAVLETAINSDLPGSARAVVSREVRSFDGTRVLIPRGSQVIGQYSSGIALGQSRVFVIWTRLIRPDGVTIELSSAGTDTLGRGGLEGDVNRHFLQRFGGAILLSLLSVTGDALTAGSTQVVVNSTQSTTNAAGVALQQEVNIAPTINVDAGSPLRIFVARDLDFSVVEAGR